MNPETQLPPNSPEAERGFVGGCIQFSDVFDAAEAAGFRPDWLWDEGLRAVHAAAERLARAGSPVSLLTVAQAMKDAGNLEAVGGLGALSALEDECPGVHEACYWLDVLRDTYRRRQLVAASVRIAEAARSASTREATEAAAELAESLVLGIRDDGPRREVDGAGLAELAKASLLERFNNGRVGVPSGLRALDRRLARGGFLPGQLVILAGRPGTGKTALALSIALNVARAGTPVGFFSLEMSAEELAERAVSNLSGVNLSELLPETPGSAELIAHVKPGRKELKGLPLVLDDTPGRSIASIRSTVRRWRRKHGVGLVFVDFLQLIEERRMDRREAVDAISRGLKLIAKESRIPVLALCQLNRELEKDPERKPRLSDLRESGSIEQDADSVFMLYRPPAREGAPDPEPGHPVEVRFLIAKQRNGDAGNHCDAPLAFHRETMAFTDPKTRILEAR